MEYGVSFLADVYDKLRYKNLEVKAVTRPLWFEKC